MGDKIYNKFTDYNYDCRFTFGDYRELTLEKASKLHDIEGVCGPEIGIRDGIIVQHQSTKLPPIDQERPNPHVTQ